MRSTGDKIPTSITANESLITMIVKRARSRLTGSADFQQLAELLEISD